jgi:hypothetical protein
MFTQTAQLVLATRAPEPTRQPCDHDHAAIGKFRLFKDEGSGQVDVSSESIARITANLAELHLILADYDVRSSHAPEFLKVSSTPPT